MKTKHLIVVGAGVVGLAICVDKYYNHPTYGRGLSALLAALNLAELFA